MFKEAESAQQGKIGINGRVYVRKQEVVDFDNKISAYLHEHPEAKYHEISDCFGVVSSKVINSIHRLRVSGDLEIRNTSFTQKNGKHVEKREAIKNHINGYLDEIGKDEPADVTYLLTTLSDSGVVTSQDTVRRILKDMNKPTISKERLEVKKQIDEFNISISKKEESVLISNDDEEDLSDEDFKSSKRYFEVREALVLDLLINGTPKDEIMELTHVDKNTLKNIVRKLRRNGKLPIPPCPDASGEEPST